MTRTGGADLGRAGAATRWLRWPWVTAGDVRPDPLPPGVAGDVGIFGPGSATWRVARERVLLAGGPAALLLQVAHPLVAAGVAAHSDFVDDPLRRLRGTMGATLTITFGDHDQVRAVADAVGARHRPVQGTLPTDAGRFAAGTRYRADDPELARWVHSTLVWTAIRVLETAVAPLSAADRDSYCAEMRRFGRLFGARESALAADYPSLDSYVRQTVHDVLVVGPAAQVLAGQILAPEPPLLPGPLQWGPRVLAAGLLPAELREAYQLPWRRRDRASFAALVALTRLAVRVLPATLRFWPHYRVARERVS